MNRAERSRGIILDRSAADKVEHRAAHPQPRAAPGTAEIVSSKWARHRGDGAGSTSGRRRACSVRREGREVGEGE